MLKEHKIELNLEGLLKEQYVDLLEQYLFADFVNNRTLKQTIRNSMRDICAQSTVLTVQKK